MFWNREKWFFQKSGWWLELCYIEKSNRLIGLNDWLTLGLRKRRYQGWLKLTAYTTHFSPGGSNLWFSPHYPSTFFWNFKLLTLSFSPSYDNSWWFQSICKQFFHYPDCLVPWFPLLQSFRILCYLNHWFPWSYTWPFATINWNPSIILFAKAPSSTPTPIILWPYWALYSIDTTKITLSLIPSCAQVHY